MTIIQNIKNIDLFLIFSILILLICIILLSIGSISNVISGVIIGIICVFIVSALFIKYKKSKLQKSDSMSQKSDTTNEINQDMQDFSKERNYYYIKEKEDIQLAESNKRNDNIHNKSFWSGFNENRKNKAIIEKEIFEKQLDNFKSKKKDLERKLLSGEENPPPSQQSYFMTNNTGTSGLGLQKDINKIENQIKHAENKIRDLNDAINTK